MIDKVYSCLDTLFDFSRNLNLIYFKLVKFNSLLIINSKFLNLKKSNMPEYDKRIKKESNSR